MNKFYAENFVHERTNFLSDNEFFQPICFKTVICGNSCVLIRLKVQYHHILVSWIEVVCPTRWPVVSMCMYMCCERVCAQRADQGPFHPPKTAGLNEERRFSKTGRIERELSLWSDMKSSMFKGKEAEWIGWKYRKEWDPVRRRGMGACGCLRRITFRIDYIRFRSDSHFKLPTAMALRDVTRRRSQSSRKETRI